MATKFENAYDEAKGRAEAAIVEKAASKPWVLVSIAALCGFVLGFLASRMF